MNEKTTRAGAESYPPLPRTWDSDLDEAISLLGMARRDKLRDEEVSHSRSRLQALIVALRARGEQDAALNDPLPHMSKINRTIAYSAAGKLRSLGYIWDETLLVWREGDSAADAVSESLPEERDGAQPRLTVRLTSFPESNGKTNWTALLVRAEKWDGLVGNCGGISLDRGEMWNRVAYEAECARFLIGERDTEPHILDYGDDIKTPDQWAGEVHGGRQPCSRRVAPLPRLEQDAVRYQWLKSRIPGSAYRIMGVTYSEGGAGIDAAIDEAMATAKEQP